MDNDSSIDNFFYYGKLELHKEIQHDLKIGLLQERRSMFYFRSYGAGITAYENEPRTAAQEIGMQFDIIDFIARRNGRVSDGSNRTRNHQVAVSQNTIEATKGRQGEINIEVLYVSLEDYENPQRATIIGGI